MEIDEKIDGGGDATWVHFQQGERWRTGEWEMREGGSMGCAI